MSDKFPEQSAFAKMFLGDMRWSNENLESSDIEVLSSLYKVVCADKNLKPSNLLNLDFYKFYSAEIVGAEKDLKPSDVLNSYGLYRKLETLSGEKLTPSNFLNFFNFYTKVVDSLNEVLEPSDILNLYNFYKGVLQKDANVKPDVVLNLYNFSKEVPKDKKFEQSEILNPDFDTFRKEAVQKGFKPDAILDLYRFYKKILQKEANIKPHDILDYYNFYKETVQAGNLKHGDVLNSRFYEFHEKVVVPADESSLKMENILSFYEFYRINCANQGQADVSPEQFDIWKSFYKFYAKVSLRTDKNPKDVLNPGFYELYKKAAEFESKGLYNEAVDVFKSKKIKNLWMEFHPHYNYKNKTDVKSKLLRIFVLMFLLTSILFGLFWKVDMSTNAKVASIFVFVLLSVAFIMNEALGVRIRNWWINYKLQPHFKSYIKHYVRVIKRTPELMEFICKTGNGELHIPVDGGELVFKDHGIFHRLGDLMPKLSHTAQDGNSKDIVFITKIKKNRNGVFHLSLKETATGEPICLNSNSPYDLDERIRIIYTNIKIYQAVSCKIISRQNILFLVDEILLAAAYFCYLTFFADPNHLYCVGFLSVMVGILFCSLIFYAIDSF